MRKMLWRIKDVQEWMQALADVEQDRRAAEIAFAKKAGIPLDRPKLRSIGRREHGEEATERMLANRMEVR